MKNRQTTLPSKVKQGKVENKKFRRFGPQRSHKRPAEQLIKQTYSDSLIKIYKQEEEDVGRFADFAKTLRSK